METNQPQPSLLQKKMSHIFPTYILGYDNPNYVEQNKMLIDAMEAEPFTPGDAQPFQTLDSHLEKREEFKDFFKWIDTCLEDYRRTFQFDCDKFKNVQSWINKANDQGAHHSHVHPNSYISAIYYISENPAPTYFEDPRYQTRSGMLVGSFTSALSPIWQCPSETGSLVIFPSWLAHYTEPHEPFEGWRYTLSFNAIPVNANKDTLMEFNYNE
jgi:uncharacterized protein (TIGR02466 family)